MGCIHAIGMDGGGIGLGRSTGIRHGCGAEVILGLWTENTEGAKFWMKVFNDLRTRGVADS